MIIDCFPFFNELDLLEIRLNWLYAHVDKFVLCESEYTHTGEKKRLFFEENKARFTKFSDKIIHLVVKGFPNDDFYPLETMAWRLEKHQRNFIGESLKEFDGETNIIISDVDEIPSIEAIKSCIGNDKVNIFSMEEYNYFVDLKSIIANGYNFKYHFLSNFSAKYYFKYHHSKNWFGSVMAKKKLLPNTQYFREVKDRFYPDIPYNIVFNSGWHFSFMGGIDKIKEKLLAYAHTEYANKLETIDDFKVMIESQRVFHKSNSYLKKIDYKKEFPPSLNQLISEFPVFYYDQLKLK